MSAPASAASTPASALAVIGIDATAERVYRAMLAEPSLGELGVAEQLSVSQLDVRRAIGELLDAGLLARGDSGLTAAPPHLALSAVFDRKARELAEARATVEALQEEYRLGNPRHTSDERTELVLGEAAVEACLLRAALTARSAIRVVRGHGALSNAVAAVGAGDATVRVLIAAEVLEDPHACADLRATRRDDEQVRSLRGSHESLVVVDDHLALLPAGPQASGVACLWVTGPGLVHSVSQLFDALWESSWDVTLARSGGPDAMLDEDDQRLLTLVVAGLKDESIARQLGVGCRTVQRRLSALSRRLGARNRLELVRTAMELGLA